ncbi:vacuolar protein sorting-associated protein Vps17 [Aulographum hederae CBS 113979]|uniref:Vacuolar protein sorting-associated protein 17 n=1 Tax=Aulographum hederae CBS 113979 TaxID=1176131 RepID=A0A6G1HCJ0_9PEZI|nr:vacuolar protein sorting-associated protein Vps17 [Aulographum hederae CBS 113979]
MDYASAIPSDGASPWASSSPQHNRTSFHIPPGSVPPSPLPQPAMSSSAENEPESPNASAPEVTSKSPSPEEAEENGDSPDTHDAQKPNPHEAVPQYSQNHGHQQRYGAQRPTKAPQYKLQAKVTGLERTGRKDPIIKFDVYTNLPKFRTTQFRDVRRTHSEFVKLSEHLISANPEAFVPAVPPPLSSAGAGTDEDEARVKGLIQRWLNVVCTNDVLQRDEEMVFFVESDFGYSPVVRRKQPATGVRRKVLKQFAPPPDDTPELQEARPTVKLFYLGTMDAGQKVDRVVKQRRGLGLAEAELGLKMSQMHVQEPHQGLANAYRKLGKIIQTTGDLHAAQGTAEATTLSDPLAYHSSDAFIVKETLTNRHILLRELAQAQSATKSKLAAADRLKASSSVKRDKVDDAIAALDEARSHESYLTQKSHRVTHNLVQDRRRWFARTTADLRASIREYVVREIEAERRTLATLETVRPDIRAIDASGGLSRLGREAHPAVRRASMASSQGPKGDSWSGVPRRPGDGLNRSLSGSIVGGVPEEDEEGEEEGVSGKARKRAVSAVGGVSKVESDDEGKVDARNAASMLAQTTF